MIDLGSRIWNLGSFPDTGYRIPDTEYWIPDTGQMYRVQDSDVLYIRYILFHKMTTNRISSSLHLIIIMEHRGLHLENNSH